MKDKYKKSLDIIKNSQEKSLEPFKLASDSQKNKFEAMKKLSNIDALKNNREKILQMYAYLNDVSKPVAVVEYEKYVQNRKTV